MFSCRHKTDTSPFSTASESKGFITPAPSCVQSAPWRAVPRSTCPCTLKDQRMGVSIVQLCWKIVLFVVFSDVLSHDFAHAVLRLCKPFVLETSFRTLVRTQPKVLLNPFMNGKRESGPSSFLTRPTSLRFAPRRLVVLHSSTMNWLHWTVWSPPCRSILSSRTMSGLKTLLLIVRTRSRSSFQLLGT